MSIPGSRRGLLAVLVTWLTLLMGGCATAPAPLKAIPGVAVETLSSSISVTASGTQRSGSARGYLLFKRPDRLHVIFLSPFGSSLLELFSHGDQIACLLPGELVAYSGSASELSERDSLASWQLMRWVLARPPLPGPSLGPLESETEHGVKERIFFYDNGLVQRKVTEGGDEVVYKEYREVDGVPFPERVELTDRRGRRVKIVFEDPEVNHPVQDELLLPKLERYTVLPLALFQGLP